VSGESLTGRDLISLLDFSTEELQRILEVAAEVKANPSHFAGALAGKTLFMYFEKPSLRTRVTFEAGMTQLGGHAIYYTAADGKIGVRDVVLLKPARLTPAEYDEVRQHARLGARMVEGLLSDEQVTWVLGHHERWDGSGYPEGLKGDKIPLAGRIMGLVDVFDAATTKRVYKDPISEADGLQLITQLSGKLFDPRVVEVFQQHFDEILESKRSADQMV